MTAPFLLVTCASGTVLTPCGAPAPAPVPPDELSPRTTEPAVLTFLIFEPSATVLTPDTLVSVPNAIDESAPATTVEFVPTATALVA